MKKLFILIIFFLTLNRLAFSDDSTEYLNQISQDRTWLQLLHYEPFAGKYFSRSLVDDSSFFFSKEGKYNPLSELKETLYKFRTDILSAELEKSYCKFPARYYWLNKHFPDLKLEFLVEYCKQFNEWIDAIDPLGVTLIFPAAYLNNPASMFGHTFLRIDARSTTNRSALLSYAASFGAELGDDGGLVFAVKGLFGGYKGVFSIEPYYERVKTYSDLEHRDIWEYELNFNSEETRFMLYHIWEMKHVYFDYFFFDENCSYHLLSLLEVARPNLHLKNKFKLWAIPSDTVREIVKEQGLIKQVNFRPSRQTILRHQLSLLSESEKSMAIDIALGKNEIADTNDMPLKSKARIYEAAYEYLMFLYSKRKENKEEARERAFKMLSARSKLGNTQTFPLIPTPDIRPDEGHNTSKVSLGVGSVDSHLFSELSFRAAYHDLLDAPGGYSEGSQIEFFLTKLRYLEGEEVKLEEFLPVNIRSILERDEVFKTSSWKIGGGVTRKEFEELKKLVSFISGGYGRAWSIFREINFYTLGVGEIRLSEEYKSLDFRSGLGLEAGILAAREDYSFAVEARRLKFFINESFYSMEIIFDVRKHIDNNNTVFIKSKYIHENQNEMKEFQVGFQKFY